MADVGIKISELVAAAALDGTELIPVVQGGSTKKSTAAALDAYIKEGLDIPSDAADVGYDNTDSGLTADNVQDALDEIVTALLKFWPIDTASGDPASFPDGADQPVKRLKVTIAAAQSGSGDPSPSNVRSVPGWTGAIITVSPTQSAGSGDTYSVSWQSEVGTVYGGTLDVTTGVLTVTWQSITVDGDSNISLDTARETSTTFVCYLTLSDLDRSLGYENSLLASRMPTLPGVASSTQAYKTEIDQHETGVAGYRLSTSAATGNYVYFSFRRSVYPSITDAASATAWFASNPTQIVYVTTSPQTYQLTPTEVRTLLGQNYISANCGPVEVKYRVKLD